MIRALSLAMPRVSLHPRKILALWFGVSRTRVDLKSLDPQMLEDIGVTQAQAHKEAQRPFWDAPTNWRI
jgi:uncharacterized protein YjiS (DUF1127 family)